MEQLGIIAEDNEHRRLDRRLSDVVYLEPSALICRRLNAHNSVAEHIVEHTGRNTHAGLLVNTVDKLEELSDAADRSWQIRTLSAHRTYRQVRCGSCPQSLDRAVVLFYRVPLIDDNDRGLARLMRKTRDPLVLLGESLRPVN